VRLALLHNPSAGEEDHGRQELESMLGEAGHEVAYRSLKEDGWREALDGGADLIVIAGGDGSIRKVFTALGTSPILALPLPLGSANNIARTLGYDFASALGVLTQDVPHERRRFDLWDATSPWGTSRFVEALGGGLFSQVLAKADDAPADPSGPENVDFGLRLLAETLRVAPAHEWAIEIDGEQIEEELIGLEVMNIREIGANVPFAPAADASDGLLEIVLVRAGDRSELAAYVAARLHDEEVDPVALTVRRGRRILVEPPHEARLHVDDLLPAWNLSGTNWVEVASAGIVLDVLVPTAPTPKPRRLPAHSTALKSTAPQNTATRPPTRSGMVMC
jgi:diacylglycerol kinase (ATP)